MQGMFSTAYIRRTMSTIVLNCNGRAARVRKVVVLRGCRRQRRVSVRTVHCVMDRVCVVTISGVPGSAVGTGTAGCEGSPIRCRTWTVQVYIHMYMCVSAVKSLVDLPVYERCRILRMSEWSTGKVRVQ